MKYDSIINLPHYEPKYHKRMSKMQRAAQFNPFSALTGYDDMVKEVSRVVNERIEISEDKKEEINNKLNFLIKNNKLDSFVSITYFVSDTKKDGGKYFKYTGKIKKIDIVNKKIILNKSKIINIYDIINISSKVLR